MIGSTISHYKILDKLGEGGMGVVYKATDTKLNRTVALKFLTERVQKDRQAKARFIQEAQAAAALNHAHICTIYGVEEVDDSLFMVMEYVEGGTLRDKLPFEKTDQALVIAEQIGEALQEAHEHGIVHRDVKADNIMLTSKGQAKVMDFGLARLKGALKLTRTSSTVGTLAYMAPEQIEGGEVDHKSDIFSFGVLLFEMLSGHLPFRGEHEAAMLYSIVNEEPQDITALVPNLSPIVVSLIQRCLEKDPGDRFHHFEDITADLKRSQKKTSKVIRRPEGISDGTTPGGPEMATKTSDEKSSRSFKDYLLYVGGAILLVALGVAVWPFLYTDRPQLNQEAQIIPLDLNVSRFEYPSISSDGKWLVFPAADAKDKWDLYVMFLENREIKRITFDSTDIPQPWSLGAAFSPDGGRIAYTRWIKGSSTIDIATVNVLGGSAKILAKGAGTLKWHPSGERIGFNRIGNRPLFQSSSGRWEFWTVGSDGSDERLEFIDTVGSARTSNFSFDWSPDGDAIVYQRTYEERHHELVIRNLLTDEEKTITDDKAIIDEVRWEEDGVIFFSSTRGGGFNVWMTDDEGGEIVPVIRGEGPNRGITVSTQGNKLVYLHTGNLRDLWQVGLDGSSITRLTSHGKIGYGYPSKSSDGSRIAYPRMAGANSWEIKVSDRHLENTKTLVGRSDLGNFYHSIYSPNDMYVMTTEWFGRSDTNRIMIVPADGSEKPEHIAFGYIGVWFDENTICVWRSSGTWLVNIDSKEETRFFQDSVWARPVLNGSYIVYADYVSWRVGSEVWLVKTDRKGRAIGGTERRFFSGDAPGFVADYWWNDALYYRNEQEEVWRVDYLSGNQRRVYSASEELKPRNIWVSNYGEEMLFINSVADTKILLVDGLFVE